MKKYILLLILSVLIVLRCNSQEISNDTIQVYYFHCSDAIGCINRCITIFCKDGEIFCRRIMFNTCTTVSMRPDENVLQQSLLRYYQYQEQNNNYQIIDCQKKISGLQLDSLLNLLNEIKSYKSEEGISPSVSHYMIKDNEGTVIVIDRLGKYNKCGEIERIIAFDNKMFFPKNKKRHAKK